MIDKNVSTVLREIWRNHTHMYDAPMYYPHTSIEGVLAVSFLCPPRAGPFPEDHRLYREKLRAMWVAEQIARPLVN